MDDVFLNIEDVDFGGVDLTDINVSDFNIAGDYDEETRYCKPKLYQIKPNCILYDNAKKLAKKLS